MTVCFTSFFSKQKNRSTLFSSSQREQCRNGFLFFIRANPRLDLRQSASALLPPMTDLFSNLADELIRVIAAAQSKRQSSREREHRDETRDERIDDRNRNAQFLNRGEETKDDHSPPCDCAK